MTDRNAAEPAMPHCSLPNKMGRIVLLSLEEVMGQNGLNVILNMARLPDYVGNYPPDNFDKAFPFEALGQSFQAMDEMYGPRNARGLARKAGQSCFRMGARDFGPILGITDLAFRVLPLGMKMRVGLEVVSETFNRFTDQVMRLEEDGQRYRVVTERCGVCWERTSTSPCCHLLVGLLEEGLFWLSGGKSFYIEEVACIAAGDPACTILIGKQPLE